MYLALCPQQELDQVLVIVWGWGGVGWVRGVSLCPLVPGLGNKNLASGSRYFSFCSDR